MRKRIAASSPFLFFFAHAYPLGSIIWCEQEAGSFNDESNIDIVLDLRLVSALGFVLF
jgi:hypothetical protein